MTAENRCISCGKCLSVCPLFLSTLREDLGPRGKWFLLSKAPQIKPKILEKLASYCLGCERCAKVCTQGLNFAQELAKLKAKNKFVSEHLYAWILDQLPREPLKRITPSLLSLTPKKNIFTPFPEQLYLSCTQKLNWPTEVVIFSGCLGPYFPHLRSKLEKMLELLGLRVLEDLKWECCGLPYLLTGFPQKASKAKEHNLSLWEAKGQPLVITFCTSCYHGLSNYLIPEKNLFLADKFLTYFKAENSFDFIAHHSCHTAHDFFAKHLTSKETIDFCCGLGGSLRLKKQELTTKVTQHFWSQIQEKLPIFTNCLGCLIQLRLSSPRNKIAHWLEAIQFIEENNA